jgi:hypothetical protein
VSVVCECGVCSLRCFFSSLLCILRSLEPDSQLEVDEQIQTAKLLSVRGHNVGVLCQTHTISTQADRTRVKQL